MSLSVPPTPGEPIVVTARSLGSGSSGNALLITAGPTTLMVDCGIGIRTLRAAFHDIGRVLTDLDAVLVTHEHRDHIHALPTVQRQDLRLVATAGTARGAGLPVGRTDVITAKRPLSVGMATVHALPVMHDASEPCGYLIEVAGVGITVLTDLGTWQDHLAEAAMASDLVVLEANYNPTMLRTGPYPAHLKRRVASGSGHLSNVACGRAIAPIARMRGRRTEWWLAHLSDTNNSPERAEADVRGCLEANGAGVAITALPRRVPGPVWRGTAAPPLPESQPAHLQAPMFGLD